VTVQNRAYDGSRDIGLDVSRMTLSTPVQNDVVNVTLTGTVATKDADTSKSVTLSATYSGADKDNYTYVLPINLKVDISKKQITVSGIQANDKIYDGKTDVTFDVSQVTFGGKIGNDQLRLTVGGRFDDADAGTSKGVSITSRSLSGDDVSNYQLAAAGHQERSSANISAVPLRVIVNDVTRDNSGIAFEGPYDVTYQGFVNGEGTNVLRGALRFSGPGTLATEEGEYRVSALGLSAQNYVITYEDGTLRLGARLLQEAREIARLPVMPVRRFIETPPVVPFCQPALVVGGAWQPYDRGRIFSNASAVCGGQ